MAEGILHITKSDDGVVHLRGPLDLWHLSKARNHLRKFSDMRTIDLAELTRLDMAGALLLLKFAHKNIATENLSDTHRVLYDLVAKAKPPKMPHHHHHAPGVTLLIHLGKGTIAAAQSAAEIIAFLGQSALAIGKVIRHPKQLRVGEIVHHIEHIGIYAIPIISLVAFLISVVLAYQSIEQLRPLGAQKFTVDLITISVLREMGVLLTAIMVAGRSGSAFTAEIGVMKIREEVDALKSIGVDPFEILVVPRLIAIIIAVPLITFIGNIMGLLGGAVLMKSLINMPFDQYINRVHQIGANGHALLVGMIKAPVFALFIGIVGCMHGMKVSGSAESVGKETTNSVVKSIFLVLMLDAIFSIFFQKVGL